MPLYFRSDTRPPTEIFRKGFQPRMKCLNPREQMLRALKARKSIDKYIYSGLGVNFEPGPAIDGKTFIPIDADSNYAISITKKIDATPIFLVNFKSNSIETSYVYVICLAEPIPLQLLYRNYAEIPKLEGQRVFDLHSLQLQQAFSISSKLRQKKRVYNPREIGVQLQAYECITESIPPDNVSMAIRITRRIPNAGIQPVSPSHSLSRNCNDYQVEYKVHESISRLGSERNSYQKELSDIRSACNFEQTNRWVLTPDVSSGLGGTLFGEPVSYADSLKTKPNLKRFINS